MILGVEFSTVKPRNNGFEGTKHSYPLLPKSVIANIEIKRYECQGTRAKSAIVRFSTTLGSVIAGFYCICKLENLYTANFTEIIDI